MKTAHHILISLLCLILNAAGQTAHIINDNLQVAGTLDVEGNLLSLGSHGVASLPGTLQNFTPITTQGSSVPDLGLVSWDVNLSKATLSWRRLNDAGTAWFDGMTLMMSPGNPSVISLSGPDTQSAALTLNAGSGSAASSFPGSLSVGGTFFTSEASQNWMPNQILNSSFSVLTRTLGDGRYLRKSDPASVVSLAFGTDSSAVQSGSIALGLNAVANGGTQSPSIAIGKNVTTTATADGQGSIAIGWNAQAGGTDRPNAVAVGAYARATGHWALALGYDAEANFWNSVAIGSSARATHGYSQAIGWNSVASGYCATSLGMHTLANGYGLTALGVGNAVDAAANVTSAPGTQDLLVVGNGDLNTWPPARSNAFTLKWNGDGWIQGNFTTAKGLNVTQDAAINGDTSIQGELEAGKASFSDTVRIEPRGGISMGEFTYDPEAPPPGN